MTEIKTIRKSDSLVSDKILSSEREDDHVEMSAAPEHSVLHIGGRIEDGLELEARGKISVVDSLGDDGPPESGFPLGNDQNPLSLVLNDLSNSPGDDLGGRVEESESEPPELGECIDPGGGGGPVPQEEGSGPV